MRILRCSFVFAAYLLCGMPSAARADVIDFEGLSDSEILTNQIAGTTFSNALVLSAGIGLNEFEFPPYSGSNVVIDSGGPLEIEFANPLASFGGFFTYVTPLTVKAYDASHGLLGSASSAFSSNLALSGDGGSAPNEFLSLTLAGISFVTIEGDPFGFSFTLDDVTTTPQVSAPEPALSALMVLGLAALRSRARRRPRAQR